MECSIFWCKLLIFDLNFSKILRKSIATAFVCYCDAKHSVTSLGSTQVSCYLFFGGCGRKWAWHFRSWNSEICSISREWIDRINWLFAYWYKFRKANDNLVIIVWAWLKMGIKFTSYGTLKSGASHTYDLINWADWLNNFWFDHQSALYLWHLLGVRCSCTC